jgi:putative radical SAM enzyme (TIGR03279 family)
MLEIVAVLPGSAAEELELQPGDFLVSVNGHEVRDLIDARFYLAEEALLLDIEKASGELWELDIELDDPAVLGLEFVHPEPFLCGNNCLFCYVHQLPRGMRKSLYLKDEDYRFSFLYGAYVTLANLSADELKRILTQRLSPLYISVHATDPGIRNTLLGKQVEPIMPLLSQLVAGGISLHTQVVVCPEINDGPVLEQTITDLAALRPGISSLALVPVGLTAHRDNLPALRTPSRKEAAMLLDRVDGYQKQFLQDGSRFVFAADEFYLKSGRPFPKISAYEDFPQLENGVGMIPFFRDEIPQALELARELSLVAATTLTGSAFFPELLSFAHKLHAESAATLQVVEVQNSLLGVEISVAGLLSGGDILKALAGRDLGAGLLLPDVLLRDGTEVLLDDMTLDQLAENLGCVVIPVSASATGLVEGLLTLVAMEG